MTVQRRTLSLVAGVLALFAIAPGEAWAQSTSSTSTQPSSSTQAAWTVAQDGTGRFKTIQAAVNAVPHLTKLDNQTHVISVKAGTYREVVYVQREKRFVKLLGEDPATTIITYNLSAGMVGLDGEKIGTFRTPTVYIDADDFACENLTFENSAGRVGQALAIRIDGDRVAFKNCVFKGYQDTILGNRGRHYFEKCAIFGATDFIFGAATEWYENCKIVCIGSGDISAASTPETVPYGFVFHQCKIGASAPENRTFLGRPWRGFASTIYLDCELDDNVRSEGWNNWGDPKREKTARYSEFNSTGPGAGTGNRAVWSKQLTATEAAAITRQNVLDGWDPTQAK